MATRRFGHLALYVGGFLGPFGGGVVTAMLVEMGQDLGVSTGTAATSLTAYLFPFAAMMLVSGTLGGRWGARRTVRVAYFVYVLASLTCPICLDGEHVEWRVWGDGYDPWVECACHHCETRWPVYLTPWQALRLELMVAPTR